VNFDFGFSNWLGEREHMGSDIAASVGSTTDQAKSTESPLLPPVQVLRVDSELQLLYGMIRSFGENIELPLPDEQKKDLAVKIGKLIPPHFIHLVSQGDKRDLLSDENRCHLLRLGVGILECAGREG
jgi:hypothetical protein